MTRVGDPWALTASRPTVGTTLAAFYRCDNCMWPNAATGGTVPEHQGKPRTDPPLINPRHDDADHTWYPEAATGKTFDDVPEHIAGAADEAFKCRSFLALRAAVLMARSVVEATCKEKGITSGRLVTKIDSLAKDGHIRAHIKEAAHEIRHLGNDMAHGDFTEPVTIEEADEILEFMGEILHDVFQSPAKIARRKAAREARKASEVAEAQARKE
ncbi:DUF4145 domain-containing protein [Janibacter indicus]|nr:DUF4145 domain-containing protein [Janibacter indicus]